MALSCAVAGCAATSLAACAGPGAGVSTAQDGQTSVNTQVGDTPVTLTLFSAAGLRSYNQGLADAFHKRYPKITVKLRTEADTNYNTVLPRLLASDSAPDLVQPANLIEGVKDRLLTNLDPYAQAYGWAGKVPASALSPGRVSNGVIGSGSLFEAGGSAGPLVGVFYNKDLAAKIGLHSAPQSVADLEAAMAKAKKAGILPIVASNQDGLIGHLYSLLLGDYTGSQALTDIVDHAPGATLNTAAAVEATTVLQKWLKAGYFSPDVNAVNQEASYGQFSTGKGLFFFQGSWVVQSLNKTSAGTYGVFPMPPVHKGGKHAGMTSNVLAFSIADRSKHKDAAGLFLDFLTTRAAAEVAVANGYAALGADATASPSPSLSGTLADQIQAGYGVIAADDGFDSWLQNAAPQVGTAETQQLQLLVTGKVTPAAMVRALQHTYTSALSGQ